MNRKYVYTQKEAIACELTFSNLARFLSLLYKKTVTGSFLHTRTLLTAE